MPRIIMWFITQSGQTCGLCAWLVDSHGRSAGHRSHRTASTALVCGCHRTLASESTIRGFLWKDFAFSREISHVLSLIKSMAVKWMSITSKKNVHVIYSFTFARMNPVKWPWEVCDWGQGTFWDFFLVGDRVIFGKFDPPVGHHTGGTQVLHAV